MSKKKKIIIMSSLVFLLALTAVLNVLLANAGNNTSSAAAVTTSNYFTTFRTERSNTRSEELLQYDSVIALYDEQSVEYKNAVEQKLQIVEMMEKELLIETLIKSKGFSDAVVTIGKDSKNVNVFINSNELNYNTAMSIFSMISEELGIKSGDVIILPVYSQI